MQGAWHFPKMLPIMVHSRPFHIITWQSLIERSTPISHLVTCWEYCGLVLASVTRSQPLSTTWWHAGSTVGESWHLSPKVNPYQPPGDMLGVLWVSPGIPHQNSTPINHLVTCWEYCGWVLASITRTQPLSATWWHAGSTVGESWHPSPEVNPYQPPGDTQGVLWVE
jgi:hypothetical protein